MLNAMLSGFKDGYVMEGEEFGQIMLSWEYAETETTYSGIMHIVKFGCEFRLVDDYWLTHLHDCWIDSSDLGMLWDLMWEDMDSMENIVSDMWYHVI